MAITMEEEEVKYMLTDDQVGLLCNSGADKSFDWGTALLCASLGFLQNVMHVCRWAKAQQPAELAGEDIILACVCVACLAGGFAKMTESRRNKGQREAFLESLSKRTKRRIESGEAA